MISIKFIKTKINLLEQRYFTVSIPLLTPNYLFQDRQTDTTALNPAISTKLRVSRSTSSLYKQDDLLEIQLTQKEDLLEQTYFTGSMPLPTPNHCYKTCGGSEKFSPTTTFKKYGGKTSLGEQERYILKTK